MSLNLFVPIFLLFPLRSHRVDKLSRFASVSHITSYACHREFVCLPCVFRIRMGLSDYKQECSDGLIYRVKKILTNQKRCLKFLTCFLRLFLTAGEFKGLKKRSLKKERSWKSILKLKRVVINYKMKLGQINKALEMKMIDS